MRSVELCLRMIQREAWMSENQMQSWHFSPFSCRSSWIYPISCSIMELLDSSGMVSHASCNGIPGIWDMIIQCLPSDVSYSSKTSGTGIDVCLRIKFILSVSCWQTSLPSFATFPSFMSNICLELTVWRILPSGAGRNIVNSGKRTRITTGLDNSVTWLGISSCPRSRLECEFWLSGWLSIA